MARLAGQAGARLQLRQGLRLTPALRQQIAVLRMTAAELSAHLDAAARTNRWLDVRRPPAAASAAASDVAAGGPSLYAHVAAAIDAAFPEPAARRIALAFADVLAPSGWIAADVPAVAAAAGVGEAAAAAVLARLQRIGPAGLFARTLAECLSLQAADAGLLDAPMRAVLARLDLVAAGDIGRLAAAAGLPPAVAAARVATLRSFDPKPGAQFDPAPPAAPPDLAVRLAPDGAVVAEDGGGVPVVALRPGGDPRDPDWLAAQVLVAAVARRGATLRAVAAHVLRHQAAAVAGGPGALRPLTRAEVAAALGLSESTVSRAVAGATVAAPWGTRPLADWFAAPLGDGGASGAGARAALRRIVAGEDARAPLSDDALAARLRAEGFPAARRTVAKYRAALGLPPAARRRQRQP